MTRSQNRTLTPSRELVANNPGGLKIGIDATNLRLGGGVTHLVELLTAVNPRRDRVSRVIVWGNTHVLSLLPREPWLIALSPPQLNGSFWARVFWQVFCLTKEARRAKCDVLFVPGGSYIGHFQPLVTMSQNLLPFEWSELRRNGISVFTLKLFLLRIVQYFSFMRSDGIIFLSEYSKRITLEVTGAIKAKTVVIPHGLSHQFILPRREDRVISTFTWNAPCRLIYVSTVDAYKHQCNVLNAVAQLRSKGYPLSITFIGPGIRAWINKLRKAIKTQDPSGQWAYYLGPIPYEKLQDYYTKAEIGIFASSCETFGITLLEKMATGLPIACSRLSAMPEILQEGGLYFHPEREGEIAAAIEQYLLSPSLQLAKRTISYERAKTYSWQRSAQQTFNFLAQVVDHYRISSEQTAKNAK